MRRLGGRADNTSFFEKTFGKEAEKKRLEERNKVLEESRNKQSKLKLQIEQKTKTDKTSQNENEYFFYEDQNENTQIENINTQSSNENHNDQTDIENDESFLNKYSLENLKYLPSPLEISTVNEIYEESNSLQHNLPEGNTSVPISTKLRNKIINELRKTYEKESKKLPDTLHKLIIKLLKTQADLDETYINPENMQTVEENYNLIFNEIASEIENNLGPEFRRGIPIKIGKFGKLRLDLLKRSIHFATNNGNFMLN
jgi:hypothetical protein